MLRAGDLNHRLTIEQPAFTQDSSGDMVPAWSTLAEVWGHVAPVSAREFTEANAEQSKVTARIVIRYRADVDASMRVMHRGKAYNIEGVLPDAESGLEYITLACSEGERPPSHDPATDSEGET